MRLAARTTSTLAIVANAIVLLQTAAIAVGYIRRQGLELTHVLALLPPVAAIAIVLLVARTPPRSIGRGAAIGLASAATLYVSLGDLHLWAVQIDLPGRNGILGAGDRTGCLGVASRPPRGHRARRLCTAASPAR
jgi:hypothetical protein